MEHSIIRTEYSELMQKSYIDYAMSVIIARALPDVRDGLKPVQRRTLYDMYELGIRYDKPYRKSARIVGDTMGKYHPHGDSSIYDALVVMAQDFKKGLPLVDGHGNFGSIEGDGAAAMRYTEARLQKVTQEAYLADLDKNVVDFMPNFDETEKEPVVLPVKVPNLLVNGAEGIAVGMATSIPPHNFGEVIDGVIAYMKNPDITTEEIMEPVICSGERWYSSRTFLKLIAYSRVVCVVLVERRSVKRTSSPRIQPTTMFVFPISIARIKISSILRRHRAYVFRSNARKLCLRFS